MATVHGELVARHGAGMLVGADLPQLAVADLNEAASWLAATQTRHVIGPAADGGFWLYGGNRTRDEAAWCSLAYSRADTAQRFVRAMGKGRWKRLGRRTDLDRPADLTAVRSELRAGDADSRARRDLNQWLLESQARTSNARQPAGALRGTVR
jgi:hypothetical protein